MATRNAWSFEADELAIGHRPTPPRIQDDFKKIVGGLHLSTADFRREFPDPEPGPLPRID